jgi:hydroxymethylpyrimidine/phosphomethylpyrimidine kinase
MHSKESRPSVLVIAATDSSGGAGLTRDVRVLTDFSVDALCVATAVTAQSDKRVLSVHHVPPDVVRAQLTAAFETRRVGAVKIGMLGTRATVEAVVELLLAMAGAMATEADAVSGCDGGIATTDAATAGGGAAATNAATSGGGAAATDAATASGGTAATDAATAGRGAATTHAATASVEAHSSPSIPGRLSRLLSHGLTTHATIPIVLDPVLVSSSGGVLLDARGRAALLEKLLPQATLVTPNVPEIAALLGEPVAANEVEWVNQARRLLEFGCQAVLLKGGHATGEEAVDLLVTRAQTPQPNRRQPETRQPEAGKPTTPVGNIIIERITSKRVPATSRGTGCALATAIAAGLASGHSLVEACRRAKRYVLETMLTPPPPPER